MANDLEALQGTWNISELEVNGQRMPAASFKGSKIAVHGSKFTTAGMGGAYEGTLRLGESNRPKTIDMIFSSGPEKANTSSGIYELTGDTLQLCLTIAGSQRPAEFATRAGSSHAFEILKRDSGAPT